MFKNYLKITFRNLLRHKEYTFINIIGLSIGMACSILILLWVLDEINFDQFNKNKDDIYRVISDWEKWDWKGLPITPQPLGPAAVQNVSEITDMCRIMDFNRTVFKFGNNIFYENNGVIVDPSIFTIFTYPFKNGNPKTALLTPESIVISEKFANKYFVNSDPMGQVFEVDGKIRKVTGVFYNLPENSHIQFDFALNFEFIKEYSNYGTGWNAFNFTTYVLLDQNGQRDIAEIGNKIVQIALDQECNQAKQGVKFRLQPLKDIYLYPFGWNPGYMLIGDKSQVFIFSLIAVFILIIACVNFMNLSTARSINRAKEVGMRKTLGAMKKQLIWQFLSESIIMSFIAMLLAMVLLELSLPAFNHISEKTITTNYFNLQFILSLIGIFLITGIIAGSYPAFYLSSFNPVKILKKEYKSGKGGSSFRKFLVVFQFTLSIVLIFITIIIVKQIDYSKNLKLGYNKDQLMYIPIRENLKDQYEVMKNQLNKNSLIKNISAHQYKIASDNTPRAAGFKWEGMEKNRTRSLDLIFSGVDYNFFEMLEINIIEGRSFSKEFSTDIDGVILNKAAIKDMNLKDPIGKWISLGDWKKKIIGVAEDVHFRSTRKRVEERVYCLEDYKDGVMLIKIDGTKTSEVLKFIENEWNKINTTSPFEYGFVDEDYDNLYKSETALATIFKYFSMLAIFISCLGLFGLSLFSAEQRTKEIGVRKVLGASVPNLVSLLSIEFSRWILIANVIALPLAWYFMKSWLENFAYKTSLSVWSFVFTVGLVFIFTLVTVSIHTIKAAVKNPVEALRNE